jgi:hypothetical protein
VKKLAKKPAPREPLGRVITFYSYKGGTGRSMALANVAWILASNGYRVLAVDWDLEAPGLHRYFAPFLVDRDLTSSDGVIEFVIDYAIETMTPDEDGKPAPDDWYLEHASGTPLRSTGISRTTERSTSSAPAARGRPTRCASTPSTGETSTSGRAAAPFSTRPRPPCSASTITC